MRSTSRATGTHGAEHLHSPGLSTHSASLAITVGEDQRPGVTLRLPDTAALVRALPYLMPTPPAPGLSVLALHGTKVVDRRALHLGQSTPPKEPSDLPRWWAHLRHSLAGKNTTSVAIIAHTDAAWTSPIRDFAHHAPFEVTHLIRVHQDRWYVLDCPIPGGCHRPECSPDGAPVDASTTERPARSRQDVDEDDLAGAQALLDALRPDAENLHALVRTELTTCTKRGQMKLLNDIICARETRTHAGHRLSGQEAGTPEPLSPTQAAVLLRALADVQVRDACMIWNDAAARQLWHDLLSAAPPGHLAPAATLIAVLAYRRGHTLTATYALEHALLDDPHYALALLLRGFIDRDLPARSLDAGLQHARARTLLGPADDASPAPHRADED